MKKLIRCAALGALALVCTVAAGHDTPSAVAAEQAVVDLVNRRALRVCSDPSNLPFSNEKGEGFENKIADVIADELKVPVEYTWFPMSTGFVRQTLFSKRCDVIIGYAQGDELVLNSNAYYRSTYALITKKGSAIDGVAELSDPKLAGKKLGIIANTPPAYLMAKHNLMGNAKPFPLVVDRRFESPQEQMVKEIASGELDGGILWGPFVGWLAKQSKEPLVVTAIKTDPNLSTKMSYGVTLGVRLSDNDWKRQLNTVLRKRRADIDKVLLDFGVPVLDDQLNVVTQPRS
ncbi:MAG: substrate-binding domain-containing protein [Hyphomicrobiaceae bacterium]|nr:substrate-binding domain-containing protein [Hyphomicrobiaceae bacterium]